MVGVNLQKLLHDRRFMPGKWHEGQMVQTMYNFNVLK